MGNGSIHGKDAVRLEKLPKGARVIGEEAEKKGKEATAENKQTTAEPVERTAQSSVE